MTGVGVPQARALGVEDGVKAGDEHVGWDVSDQRIVDTSQYFSWRLRGLGYGTEHAAGAGHHQGCRHTLARCVSHDQSQSTFREEVEVVEVSSYLPGWLVVGSDLPALQSGHPLGQGGLLDPSRHPHLLLYALALALYLCKALLLQGCDGACPLPLLGYLAPLYAVDIDDLVRRPSTGRCETLVLPPIVDTTSRPAGHHLIAFGDLILDDVADL